MLALLALLSLPRAALALPDVVRIEVTDDAIRIDHPSVRDSDHYAVKMLCEDGVDNPVVVTNAAEHDIVVTSSEGLARLAAPGKIGTHSATFRSLPRDVADLTVANPYAKFIFACESD